MHKHFTELPHIVVGFYGGTGGNFVGRVLAGLQHSVLTNIPFTDEGSAHRPSKNDAKVDQWLGVPDSITGDAEKREYILERFSGFSFPRVVAMHDLKHFYMYRDLLPNSKFVTITINSRADGLVSDMNFVRKWYMEESKGTHEAYLPMKDAWTKTIHKLIADHTGRTDIADIVMSRLQEPKFIEIIMYFHSLDRRGKWYTTEMSPAAPYSVILPFACIRHNDVDTFLKIIEQVHGTDLTANEQSFVTGEFNRYQALQITEMMEDPYAYLDMLEVRMNSHLKELCDSTPYK